MAHHMAQDSQDGTGMDQNMVEQSLGLRPRTNSEYESKPCSGGFLRWPISDPNPTRMFQPNWVKNWKGGKEEHPNSQISFLPNHSAASVLCVFPSAVHVPNKVKKDLKLSPGRQVPISIGHPLDVVHRGRCARQGRPKLHRTGGLHRSFAEQRDFIDVHVSWQGSRWSAYQTSNVMNPHHVQCSCMSAFIAFVQHYVQYMLSFFVHLQNLHEKSQRFRD